MANASKTLQLIASKLGLGDEDKVLSKAAEFERLLLMKSRTSINISDISKVAICLDLAASMLGVEFDVKEAIKQSCLKPPIYKNYKKVAANLLELNSDKLTTAVLCAAMQCSTVQALADRILDEYQKSRMVLDLDLPQYVCMAVFQACRLSKVKLSKSKITEKSGLKPAQWAKLDAEWTKFADENFAAVAKKKKGGRPPKNPVAVEIEEKMEMDNATQKEEQPIEPIVEPYPVWKRRMLETAYKQLTPEEREDIDAFIKQDANMLKELEYLNIQSKTPPLPRRSPRKTPQKFQPYASPIKGKGVRLLFPL